MKTVSKTFYVDDETMKYLKSFPEAPYHYTGMTSFLNKQKYGESVNEITISWKESREVTISEEDFDSMFPRDFFKGMYVDLITLRKKLFGDE